MKKGIKHMIEKLNTSNLLSIKKAAKYLDVTEDCLRKWENNGKVKALKTPGGHRRYRKEDLDKLIGLRENSLITDEILEQMGFEKSVVTYKNRDELLNEFQKYPLLNDKPLWNNITFHENALWFRIGYNRFLEKLEHGYLLIVFDVTNKWVTPDENQPAVHKEVRQISGPFWVTSIFTLDELYGLLTALHIDFKK